MSELAAPQACPVCAESPRRDYLLANGSALLRCPRCGLGWWDWPAFDPTAFYDQDYFQSADSAKGYNDYAALEPGVRRTARARLRRILQLRPGLADRTPSLLEIGCGTGCFLDEAAKLGWKVQGLEVSPYAARVAAARGHEVACGIAEEARFPEASFDVVALWDLIEHVRDPAALFAIAARALRPGGVLALSTGDLTSWCARLSGPRWHLFNLPEHLFFFSPASLERLLANAGCRVERRVHETNWVPVAYLAERLAKPFGMDGKVAHRFKGWRWIVPATLFDVIGLYAVKQPASAAPARAGAE